MRLGRLRHPLLPVDPGDDSRRGYGPIVASSTATDGTFRPLAVPDTRRPRSPGRSGACWTQRVYNGARHAARSKARSGISDRARNAVAAGPRLFMYFSITADRTTPASGIEERHSRGSALNQKGCPRHGDTWTHRQWTHRRARSPAWRWTPAWTPCSATRGGRRRFPTSWTNWGRRPVRPLPRRRPPCLAPPFR
jgi:hypothetical protein